MPKTLTNCEAPRGPICVEQGQEPEVVETSLHLLSFCKPLWVLSNLAKIRATLSWA